MTWTITGTTTISASRAVTLPERIAGEPIKFVVLHPGTGVGGTVTIWDDLGRSVSSTRVDALSPRHEAEFYSDRSTFNVSAAIDGNATVSGAGISVYLVSREAPDATIASGSTSFDGPVRADRVTDSESYKTKIVRDRIETIPGTIPSGNALTLFLTKTAPARFVAVRAILGGETANATNQYTVSFSPSATYGNGYTPKDASNATLTPTVLKWGGYKTSNDFRNVGGGANTTTLNTATGSYAAKTLLQNVAVSDWLFVRSLARTDFPTRLPLYMVRLYGLNAPAYQDEGRFNRASPNPRAVIDPDFFSGYVSAADHTVTEPGAAPVQGWCPNIDLEFLLMDGQIISYAVAGDSLEHGYCPTNAVPLWGGGSNAWPRKLESMIRASGKAANCVSFAQGGQESHIFNEMFYDSLTLSPPGYTFAFIKPWSVNSLADNSISVYTHTARCDRVLSKCIESGVTPIIIRPWAGQATTSERGLIIQDYCNKLEASGFLTFDPNLEIASADNPSVILPQYLNIDSNGTVIDNTHLNEAGQDKIAAAAYRKLLNWGFI